MNRNSQEYKDNKVFQKIAAKYTEHDGELLKEELKHLENNQDNQKILELDRLVSSYVKKKRKIKWIRRICEVAACVVLVVGISMYYQSASNDSKSNEQPLDLAATETKKPDLSGGETALLSESLPIGFNISNTKEDLGQIIYYIENDLGDDVVLVVGEENKSLVYQLEKVKIKDTEVYKTSKDGYHFLIFWQNEFSYTLTCKYELDTLIEVSRSIINNN